MSSPVQPTPELPNSTKTAPGEVTLSGDRSTASPSGPSGTGRYLLGEEIARGGMGEVYRATDTVLNREVAVKVLQEKFGPNSSAARRFDEEARITGQLQHPNIPAVHDLGTLPDGRPFLAMKLIKGETLDELLKRRSSSEQDRGRFIAVFEQVCQALAYAHSYEVIHRDLKPANIMVGAFGEVQVMDWGLAKVLSGEPREAGSETDPDETAAHSAIRSTREEDERFTHTGSVLGTLAYMPPEQAIGAIDQIDQRSDVFGLGGILCVILTGQPPYVGVTGESTRQLAAMGKVQECFARLASCGAEPELVALCQRCLSVDKGDRPPDAEEVARVLAKLRLEAEERARQAELEAVRAKGAQIAVELQAEGERQKTEEQRKRRRVQKALIGAILLLVIGGGVAGKYIQIQLAERALADQAKKEQDERVQLSFDQALGQLPEMYRRAQWRQATGVLDKAESLLGPDANPELRRRLNDARSDLALVRELDEIRLSRYLMTGGPRKTDQHQRYAAAFHSRGLNLIELSVDKAADWLNRSHVQEFILTALDDWGLIEKDASLRDRIWAATIAVDGAEWRITVRKELSAAKASDEIAANRAILSAYQSIPPKQRTSVIAAAAANALKSWRIEGKESQAADKKSLEKPYHEALKILAAALLDFPNDVILLYELASIYEFYGGRPDDWAGAAAIRGVIALRPDDANAYAFLGWYSQAAIDTEAGIAAYRKAIALGLEWDMAYYWLSVLLKKTGQTSEALDVICLGVSRFPRSAHLCYSLAQHHDFTTNDLPAAISAYRQLLTLEGHDYKSTAVGALNRLWAEREGIEQADIKIKALAVEFPATADIARLWIARNRVRVRDYNRAADEFRSSLRTVPPNQAGRVNFELAKTLQMAGKLDDSLKAYESAFKMQYYGLLLTDDKGQPSQDSTVAKARVIVERLKVLEGCLPEIVLDPSTVPEEDVVPLADLCVSPAQQRYLTATRLYERGTKLKPVWSADDTPLRVRAARAYLLAAEGMGIDTNSLKESDVKQLRKSALAILYEHFSQLQKSKNLFALRQLKGDMAFAAVREPAGLAKLPQGERENWEAFWSEVRASLTKSERTEFGPQPRSAK